MAPVLRSRVLPDGGSSFELKLPGDSSWRPFLQFSFNDTFSNSGPNGFTRDGRWLYGQLSTGDDLPRLVRGAESTSRRAVPTARQSLCIAQKPEQLVGFSVILKRVSPRCSARWISVLAGWFWNHRFNRIWTGLSVGRSKRFQCR